MSKETEPSVLEYARYYNLSKNHMGVDPLRYVPPPDQPPLQLDTEPAWLQSGPSITTPPSERLIAVKEASALLAVTDPKQYGDYAFEALDLAPTHRIRHLKVELPLLRSDHEMDMLNFARRIEPNLAEEFIPFEKVDNEQDEGPEWPSYCHAWPAMYFQKAQNEKLEVARDVIAYMKAALNVQPENREPALEYDWPTPQINRARGPITPPLLPRSPSPQQFEPSSETGRLDFLSDHSTPDRHELDRINRALVENDSLDLANWHSNGQIADPEKLDTNNIGDLYSPLRNIHVAPSPPQRQAKRTRDLQVEGPLTPPLSSRPAPWDGHKVSLSEVLQTVHPSVVLPLPELERTPVEDIRMLFAEHIVPMAAKAERQIEQEQLQEADTTCRVPVPVMDFSKPKPQWDNLASDITGENKSFLRKMKDTHLSLPPWRLGAAVERELSWKPFTSSLGQYQIQETIEDDGSLASFIAQPDPPDLDNLMWKRPGLRILDEISESEEEELTYSIFPPAKDVRSLIKKRNFELQTDDDHSNFPVGTGNAGQGTLYSSEHRQPNKKIRKREELGQAKSEVHKNTPEPSFSAMGALDEFLGLRKGRIEEDLEATVKMSSAIAPRSAIDPLRPHETAEAKPVRIPEPLPEFKVPTVQTFLVASTSFLSDRKLVRSVQILYPSATIIERDFALQRFEASYQYLTKKAPRTLPGITLDEADLIVSPSTGLILTSLLKIKQQALPGQAAHSPVRERIEGIAGRYERLVVVVSRAAMSPEMDSDFVDNLDESDCEALVSLTAFLGNLPALSESELLFVDGDTSALARWIVSLVVKYSAGSSTQLLEEETQWEVFLRQVGMNAFAAQAVLAELKLLAETEGETWGLRDFVLMSHEEKCRRFEGLLGGRKLLERVGKVLDAQWLVDVEV